MQCTYHLAHRYAATHARPRPPGLTRALLAAGALLVAVTLGFGGYAAGTALTHPGAQATRVKVIPAPMPAHAAPHHPRSAPAPAVSPTALRVLHALHVWHVRHMAHVAHLEWLKAHGVLTE